LAVKSVESRSLNHPNSYPAEIPFGGGEKTPVPPRDSHHRSIAKAVSWRITGTLDTFILSYLITGNLVFAGVETMTKIVLYYAHERIWSGITWGGRSSVTPPVKGARAVRPIWAQGRAIAQTPLRLWKRRRYEFAGATAILAIFAVIVGSPLSLSRPSSKAAAAPGLMSDSPSSITVALIEQPDAAGVPAHPVKHEALDAQPLANDTPPLQDASSAESDPVATEQDRATALKAPNPNDAGSAPERPSQPPRHGAPIRSLSDVDQARLVQQRLAELGFFHASATGVWGSNSRQALATFKAQARLSEDDVWDEATERSLFGAEVHSVSFVGQWAPNAQACTPQLKRSGLLPATINEQGAWAGETTCKFQRKKQVGTAWTMVATCSDQRSRWTANVRLEIRGDRLTWSSERGSQTYVRCRQGQLYAQVAN